jgi:hypothetical protein
MIWQCHREQNLSRLTGLTSERNELCLSSFLNRSPLTGYPTASLPLAVFFMSAQNAHSERDNNKKGRSHEVRPFVLCYGYKFYWLLL